MCFLNLLGKNVIRKKQIFSHGEFLLSLKVRFKLSQHIGARNYPLIKQHESYSTIDFFNIFLAV